MTQDETDNLVCVLCGAPWPSHQNVCKCGGICTWGESKGSEPMSWTKTDEGYVPTPPPVIRVTAKVGTIPFSQIQLHCERVECGQRVEWREDKPGTKWETGIITEVRGDPCNPDHVFLDRH